MSPSTAHLPRSSSLANISRSIEMVLIWKCPRLEYLAMKDAPRLESTSSKLRYSSWVSLFCHTKFIATDDNWEDEWEDLIHWHNQNVITHESINLNNKWEPFSMIITSLRAASSPRSISSSNERDKSSKNESSITEMNYGMEKILSVTLKCERERHLWVSSSIIAVAKVMSTKA